MKILVLCYDAVLHFYQFSILSINSCSKGREYFCKKLHSHLYLFLYQLPSLRKLINSFEKCSFDAFQHFLKEICTNDSNSKILMLERKHDFNGNISLF